MALRVLNHLRKILEIFDQSIFFWHSKITLIDNIQLKDSL